MAIRTAARLAAAAAIVLAGASSARADLFTFANTNPASLAPNNAGGTFHSVSSTFDTGTRELSWTVNFSDRVTKGFWMSLSCGPNPKTHPGELAIFYFDAKNVFDANPATDGVKLTAYGYNGQNSPNSWQDGNPLVAGNQPPDLIKGATDTAWILNIAASDIVLPGEVNGRQLTFTIDAGDIIDHTPLYPDAVDPWCGTGFADQIGLWLHPAREFNLGYGDNGRITSLGRTGEGSLDGAFMHTLRVPAPGAAALIGAGALLLVRRRHR